MRRDLTVYTCAVWYRDNDAHTSIVATTARKAKTAALAAMRETAQRDAHNDDTPCAYCGRGRGGDHVSCLMDAQAWSGVHPESLRDVYGELRSVLDRFDSGSRGRGKRAELRDDLRASGVAYLETM